MRGGGARCSCSAAAAGGETRQPCPTALLFNKILNVKLIVVQSACCCSVVTVNNKNSVQVPTFNSSSCIQRAREVEYIGDPLYVSRVDLACCDNITTLYIVFMHHTMIPDKARAVRKWNLCITLMHCMEACSGSNKVAQFRLSRAALLARLPRNAPRRPSAF